MVSHLLGIHFDNGVQMPHFVNGRLLTADDLRAEQDATRTRLRHLGRAAGYGVVQGLEVAPAAGANNLTISPGIGLNRSGDLIHLDEPGAQISLVIPPDANSFGEDAGRFHDCGVAPSGTGISPGAYLLYARPISRLEGSAPVKSINGNLATCASKWEVDGLEFVAIPLTKFPASSGPQLRNLLAHWCFGSEGLKRLFTNPFDFGLKEYLNLLPANLAELTLCDLPLAVFTWTAQGLGLLDNWAARRRIVTAYPASSWDAFLSDERVAEAQARFLQFQEQLENIRASDKAATVAATKYFRYLPPVGLLPIAVPDRAVERASLATLSSFFAMLKATSYMQERIQGNQEVTARLDKLFQSMSATLAKSLVEKARPYFTGGNAFDLATFFGPRLPDRVGVVSRETLEFTLNHSWYDEVIDLQEGTPFDILLVQETLNRTLSSLLFLMLDAEQVKFSAGASRLRVNSLLDESGALIPLLWKQTNLRQTFFASIATDAAVAVQEIAEGKPSLNYAMFVKRIPPVKWLSLQQDRPEPVPGTPGPGSVPDIDITPGTGVFRPDILRSDIAARILDRIAWASAIDLPTPPP